MPGSSLRLPDGRAIQGPMTLDEEVLIDSLALYVVDAGDDRRWVTARDMRHPSITTPPSIETYPVDARWRKSARFDAFDSPRPVQVPDVRGGSMNFLSLGELVFRFNNREHRLIAFGEPGGGEFFVMFKDSTNFTTTYEGYRIVTPAVVNGGEFTVVDFNFAFNPPCAYSRYTLCPLPPRENRLQIAVEAGLKRLPSAQGLLTLVVMQTVMAAGDELLAFVRDALSRGVPRTEIEDVLRRSGWTTDQIRGALTAYADIDFPIPVPRARPYLSAREAFMYLVLFGTLYASAYNLGSLIFDFINLAFPDASQQSFDGYGQYVRESIRWSISWLIVAFPVFLYLSWLTERDVSRDPVEARLEGATMADVSHVVLGGMRPAR